MSEDREFATQDMLRAMAHPLRLRIMERVSRLGTARAVDVAQQLGMPANSVSYHLRILARGGVIEEAPEKGRDRRDRVWRLTQRTFRSGSGAQQTNDPGSDSDAYDAAALAMGAATLEAVRAGWLRQSARRRAGDEGAGLGRLDSTTLHVTTAQAKELSDRVGALIKEYTALNRDEQGVDQAPAEADVELTEYRVLYALVAEAPADAGGDSGSAPDRS